MGKISKKIIILIISAIIFAVVAIPCRELFSIMELTKMRPASAFPTALGLMFGPYAAVGCAIGNVICDIVTGCDTRIMIISFFIQILYGILPYMIWKKFSTNVRIDNLKKLFRYIGIIFIDSIVVAVLLGIVFQIFNVEKVISMLTLMIFLNNFVFSMVLGIPIIIGITIYRLKKFSEKISLSERIMLIFLLLSAVSAVMKGIFVYNEHSAFESDMLVLWNTVYGYMVIDLLIFYFIAVLFLWFSEKKITSPLEGLTEAVDKYIEDDKKNSKVVCELCTKIENSGSETGILASAFKEMVIDVDKYVNDLINITTEKEKIDAELNIATKIQANMLPKKFLNCSEIMNFDLYATMEPAKEVGGDFYDYFMIDDNHVAIVIGDVSGKGVPAALFMVISKTIIKNYAMLGLSVDEIFTRANNDLCEGNNEGLFTTAWLGIFEISTGILRYADAGHEPPIKLSEDGTVEYIKPENKKLMLAAIEDTRYVENTIKLNCNETILLYTDGVPEAINTNKKFYGLKRLKEVVNDCNKLTPNKLIEYIREDINSFSEGAAQFDDLTMLAFKIIK